jgi:hypothetical protein
LLGDLEKLRLPSGSPEARAAHILMIMASGQHVAYRLLSRMEQTRFLGHVSSLVNIMQEKFFFGCLALWRSLQKQPQHLITTQLFPSFG